MRKKSILRRCPFFAILVAVIFSQGVIAEVLYVDSINGNNKNPGTREKPLSNLGKAVFLVNNNSSPGPAIIKILPGIYNLTQAVVIKNTRPYTEKDRLTIEASVLPDDPGWKPQLMPMILSTENPRNPEKPDVMTGTYGIKIKVSHVTISGLRFLGNPILSNMHACIERIGEKLDDLVVKQCLFVGNTDGMNIYCATLATGDRFIVEHCIFKNCHGCAVYWDGYEGIGGKGCAMRYCIIDGAYISGVWTCQTSDDFEFHHNVIANGEYFWMRKRGDHQKYKIKKCIIIGNKYWSGYGTESGATSQTGNEVSYEEVEVVTNGTLNFETNKRARNYMHIVGNSTGYDLRAGLFINETVKQ